jgi:diacylglycerol kinase (ATP)
MKKQSLLDSFNHALQGVIEALKSERNLKIHFVLAFAALISALFFDFTPAEFLILIAAITLVIVAELFNTSIEAVVDLICGERKHPLAKLAKDVAAGAVFITAMNAVIVAYILFYSNIDRTMVVGLAIKMKQLPIYVTFISLLLIFLLTVTIKAATGHTKPFKGGMPSGHSAVAFGIATCIALLTEEFLAISLAYLLALLVAQSRIEGKIHTYIEAIAGAFIGTFTAIIIFQIFA